MTRNESLTVASSMNRGPPVSSSGSPPSPSSGRLGFLGADSLGAGRSIVILEMAFPSFGKAGMLPSNVRKLSVVFHPKRKASQERSL